MEYRYVIISVLVIPYLYGHSFANVADEVRITKVTEVQAIMCPPGYVRDDLQYLEGQTTNYTLSFDGSAEDPVKALRGFAYGQLKTEAVVSTYSIHNFFAPGFSETLYERKFAFDSIYFHAIGADKIEIVLTDGIIFTFRWDTTLDPFAWEWIRIEIPHMPTFTDIQMTFVRDPAVRKLKLYDIYMQACSEPEFAYLG